MVKAKVIEDFTLRKFNELRNIERANANKNAEGYLYKDDTFECDEEMAKYLTKTNAEGRPFIQIIEIKLEKMNDFVINKKIEKEEKPKRKRRTIAKED